MDLFEYFCPYMDFKNILTKIGTYCFSHVHYKWVTFITRIKIQKLKEQYLFFTYQSYIHTYLYSCNHSHISYTWVFLQAFFRYFSSNIIATSTLIYPNSELRLNSLTTINENLLISIIIHFKEVFSFHLQHDNAHFS